MHLKSNNGQIENEAEKYWEQDLDTKTPTHNYF